ncbi:MAG: DNA/RNA non-specific endonuclease [Candidatus Kapabacteria bacterium]|nr:DNA/RNA non-specific endonuclease [Candidatus Kapabacteria bacterium]
MTKLIIIFLFVCSVATATENVHILLGTPTNPNQQDYIIIRPQYVVGYNPEKGIPNWVSWNMNADWFGDVERYSGSFIRDTSLPLGMYRVKHADYTNSGYDRGHMVRSEERTATVEDNKSTFIITNVAPQTPDLNRGVWLDFEYFLEDLCKIDNRELYVMAGSYCVVNNTLLDEGLVVIPESYYKIAVMLDKGRGLSDVTTNTTVYAVLMPNIDGVRSDKWSKYQTTVDNIEFITGYDFLNLVPSEIQDVIESGSTSVSSMALTDFKLYPNPTKSLITIEGFDNVPYCYVFDTLGRLVLTANIEFSPYVIDLSNLDNGVYLLKCGEVVRVVGKY